MARFRLRTGGGWAFFVQAALHALVHEANNYKQKIIKHMKKILVPIIVGVSAMTFLTGCLEFHFGGGSTSTAVGPSVGQQLVDLQKAKAVGAITDAEFQVQKAKLIETK